MKLSYPPLIVLGCIAVQVVLNMLVPLEVNLSLLLGLIVLILSLGIITYAFRELNNIVGEMWSALYNLALIQTGWNGVLGVLTGPS